MSKIQQAIQLAASRFATEVVSILRGATLQDIATLTGKSSELAPALANGRSARRGRRDDEADDVARRHGRKTGSRKRSPEEVSRLADRVLDFLKSSKQEIGVSGIGEALKVPTAALGLPLTRLRQEGKVKTHGQKRSTVYRIA